MPNRILREGIIESRAVNSLSDSGELFYRRLMSIVDDYGRIEADPEVLRARLFSRSLDRWPLSRVSSALTEVSGVLTDDGHPLLTVYRVSNHNFLQINNFNQRIRAAISKCPSPDGQVTVICQTDADHARARTPSSSSIDSAPKGGVGENETAFDKWIAPWPRNPEPETTLRLWISLVRPVDEEAVFACRDRYFASEEFGRGVVMDPHNFLSKQAQSKWCGKWPQRAGKSPPVLRLQPRPATPEELKEMEENERRARA